MIISVAVIVIVIACSAGGFGGLCFAAILDSLQIGKIGARMTECRRGWGAGKEK